MAQFDCGSCGYARQVPDKLSGQKAKCPKCKAVVEIVPDAEIHIDSLAGDSPLLEEAESVVHAAPEKGSATELPEPDVDSVEIDDLADEKAEAQVWDADYDADSAVTIETDSDKPAASKLFAGGVFPNIFAGVVTGLIGFFFAISYAMLGVSQIDSTLYFPSALSMLLVSTAVMGIVYSLRSRISFGITGPETAIMALVFTYIGSVYRGLQAFPPASHFPTLLASIMVLAVASGMCLILMGRFKAGQWCRYIPIQILGGVLGAAGFFVIVGTLDIMGNIGEVVNSGLPMSLQYVLTVMKMPSDYLRIVPSVAFGLALFILLKKYKNSFVLLGMIIFGVGISYLLPIVGMDSVLAQHFAAPIAGAGADVSMYSQLAQPEFFGNIQWQVIMEHELYIGAMVVLLLATILFRATRMENETLQHIDLSEEFRAVGLANMCAGFVGGMPGSISHGRSMGNRSLGGKGALSGLIAGLVAAAMFALGDLAFMYIPRYVPEGILIFMGLGLVRDWSVANQSVFTRKSDNLMLGLVFVVTIVFGFLIGIGTGFALSLIITVNRTSLGGAFKNLLSGDVYHSNVDRAPYQFRALKESGERIYIMRLQGFMFLGTVHSIVQAIQKRIDDSEKEAVEFVILDFGQVTGFASMAGVGFTMLSNLALEHEINLIFTAAPLELEEHLVKAGFPINDMEGSFKVFMNLDFALEWCEDRILEAENLLDDSGLSLPELLEPVFPEPRYIPALMKAMQRMEVDEGAAIIRQGDISDSMFFVESGRLDVELEKDGGKVLRIKKVGPGAVVGEMGLYTHSPRSATVRAAEPCVVYRMSVARLKMIEKRAPALVSAVNKFLINMLSERLADTNMRVRNLM